MGTTIYYRIVLSLVKVWWGRVHEVDILGFLFERITEIIQFREKRVNMQNEYRTTGL